MSLKAVAGSSGGGGAVDSVNGQTGVVVLDIDDIGGVITDGVTITGDGTTGDPLVAVSGGSGDVTGPAAATDNAVARYNLTTGKLIQNSAVTIADTTGVIAGTQGVTFSGSTSGTTSLQPTAIAGTTTLTLPAATDTLTGKATTDTFTNKTFDTAGAGNAFAINGTSITAVNGTGAVVLTTSPSIVTPNINVATATSLNKVTITAPATGSTLTIQDGFTLTANGNATVSGTNTGDQTSVTGNAGTATALQMGRLIGGVNFDGTANIVPQTIQSVNEASDTTCFPLFISASGSQSLQPLNNASLTFNASTATLGATNLSGTLTTAAQTNITSVGTLSSLTLGGTLALGANNLTMTGALAATGARVSKGWFTDIESTNAPTIGGVAASGTGGLARLISPTFTGTPVLSTPSATSLTFTSTSEIIGTTTNNNAAAGSVGEYVESKVASGSAVSLTTNIQTNVTSISLTAGDWDVWANYATSTNVATVVSVTIGSINSTSATLGNPQDGGYTNYPGDFKNVVAGLSAKRFSLSGTTTIYLVGYSVFTTNTQAMYGGIFARRVR